MRRRKAKKAHFPSFVWSKEKKSFLSNWKTLFRYRLNRVHDNEKKCYRIVTLQFSAKFRSLHKLLGIKVAKSKLDSSLYQLRPIANI